MAPHRPSAALKYSVYNPAEYFYMSANFPALVPVTITILSGETVSVPMALPGLSLRKYGTLGAVQVDCPPTMTSTAAEIQFHSTDVPANFTSRYEVDGTLVSFSAAAGRAVLLPATKYCAVFPYVRIKVASSSATDVTYTVWLREL